MHKHAADIGFRGPYDPPSPHEKSTQNKVPGVKKHERAHGPH